MIILPTSLQRSIQYVRKRGQVVVERARAGTSLIHKTFFFLAGVSKTSCLSQTHYRRKNIDEQSKRRPSTPLFPQTLPTLPACLACLACLSALTTTAHFLVAVPIHRSLLFPLTPVLPIPSCLPSLLLPTHHLSNHPPPFKQRQKISSRTFPSSVFTPTSSPTSASPCSIQPYCFAPY